MFRVAIVYLSREGSTEWVAEQIRHACIEEEMQASLLPADGIDMEELLVYDAYAFGSPDYLGYMAGEMKCVFDRLSSFRPVILGRPFIAFITYESDKSIALSSLNDLGQGIGLRQAHPGLAWRVTPGKKVCDACVEMVQALREQLRQ